MDTNYKLESIFSSFLAEFQLDIDHAKVRDWIYTQVEDETNKVELTFDEPELQEFYSATLDAFTTVHHDIGLRPQWSQVLIEAWANAGMDTRFEVAHHHPRASFVSVYYPEAKGDNVDCGPLELVNPVTEAQRIIHSETNYTAVADYNQYTAQRWRVVPKTGKLVIFPAWIQHYVLPKLSPGGRLSIAVNSTIVLN